MLAAGFVIDHRSWAPTRKTDIDAATLAADRAWTPAKQEDNDMTDAQYKALMDQVGAARGAAEQAYNAAHHADAAVMALAAIVGRGYDVIRASDSPVTWAVVGDHRLHIPSQIALAAFGGGGVVEVVNPDDPRLQLPVVELPAPPPNPEPTPPAGPAA